MGDDIKNHSDKTIEQLVDRVVAAYQDLGRGEVTSELVHYAVTMSMIKQELIVDDDALLFRVDTPRGPIFARVSTTPAGRQHELLSSRPANVQASADA